MPKQGSPAKQLAAGEPAPWFEAPTLKGNPTYTFDTAAGRAILLLFFGSAAQAQCAEALRVVTDNRDLFDDARACFFGITIDENDAATERIVPMVPGIRYILDYRLAVSRLYGALSSDESTYRPHWLLLDRMLRVVERFPVGQSEAAIASLRALIERPATPDWAPVLLIPRVFDRDLCRSLIDYHTARGDSESGFMCDVEGRSRLLFDPKHKIRRDCMVEDQALQHRIQSRIRASVLPMVQRAFQFGATRMERYLIGCYRADEGGHFRAHRDNTTKSTEHRRFAVTINLNEEDYEGGNLVFPEYGDRAYRAPTGGAIVFSCGLLHQAMPVTRGVRLAFLPFLYDDAAAELRARNNAFLSDGIRPYELSKATT